MTAQIQRTHQGLDQCCRPVVQDLVAIAFARIIMVHHIVGKLSVSHPDAVDEMMSLANGVIFKLHLDGTVTAPTTTTAKVAATTIPFPTPRLERLLRADFDRCATGMSSLIFRSAEEARTTVLMRVVSIVRLGARELHPGLQLIGSFKITPAETS